MATDLNPILSRDLRRIGQIAGSPIRGQKHCHICAACFFCLLSSVFCSLGMAQALSDPTKPPAELSAHPGAAAPEDDGLQSIIISPTRRAAIINGQTVELGGKAGDVSLIEVNESGVVLQGAKGRQVLTLFPDVKINRKALVPPMEDDVKHPARKEDRVSKPGRQTGKKEEK